VIVRAEAVGDCMPTNLETFKCDTVLLVGDTHHWAGGLVRLLRYARAEPFHAAILDYTRHHAHFFMEAGVSCVRWLPGLNVARMPFVASDMPGRRFTMVGHLAGLHVRRESVVRKLRHANMPLEVLQAPGEAGRMLQADSRLNLNCSLNGDLNLRVLEVLQTGSALLTDRLAPESGMDLLVEDGVHLCTYASPEEAIANARQLLDDPGRCRTIGQAGRARYESTVAPEMMAEHLLNVVRGRQVPEMFDPSLDPRTRLIREELELSELMWRVAAYESVQELHLRAESTSLLAAPNVDAQMLADLLDLPRLCVMRSSRSAPDGVLERLSRTGVGARIKVPERDEACDPDLLLLDAADLGSPATMELRRLHPSARIVTIGSMDPTRAAAFGLEPVVHAPSAWQPITRKVSTRFKNRRS
jgi:hypothetical protein